MRKVILDTETTGLDFTYDRIWEIGAIEMIGYEPTGNVFHYYLNPERRLSEEAVAISNMSDDYLADKPLFKNIVQEFLEFIDGAVIVAHNANFDVQMINSELTRIKMNKLKNEVIDTLEIARKTYPGGHNSLDNLCKKFKVNTNRGYHGALKDAQDLSGVYYYLMNAYGIKNSSIQNDLTMETIETFEENALFVFDRVNISKLSVDDVKTHMEYCKIHNIDY